MAQVLSEKNINTVIQFDYLALFVEEHYVLSRDVREQRYFQSFGGSDLLYFVYKMLPAHSAGAGEDIL